MKSVTVHAALLAVALLAAFATWTAGDRPETERTLVEVWDRNPADLTAVTFRTDGRTVLIDWAYVGEGPACHELGWYLALNRAKLPTSKERTIEAFRRGLERHGVDTTGWWQQQLDLALLGTVVQFGWEKALGDEDELAWWCAVAERGLARL